MYKADVGPGPLWPAPVYALKQHGQLRLPQRHAAAGSLRPDEATALESLGQHTQPITAPPQHVDFIAAPTPENKHVAVEWPRVPVPGSPQ